MRACVQNTARRIARLYEYHAQSVTVNLSALLLFYSCKLVCRLSRRPYCACGLALQQVAFPCAPGSIGGLGGGGGGHVSFAIIIDLDDNARDLGTIAARFTAAAATISCFSKNAVRVCAAAAAEVYSNVGHYCTDNV